MMRVFRLFPLLLIFIALSAAGSTVGSVSRPPRSMSAAEIQLAIKRLRVVGSALYVAAHPDDENTAMLAWLGNGRLLRTGYLSMTRGSGGQNLIGSEKGDLLGVIRTQELLEARRIDGAEQFFTRTIDFGYSKSSEETLRIWGKERALADVVWVIRKFRPDVIITRFPIDGAGGHGHHTASAILALEAFRAAGDPSRFPEQLALVEVWQPKRIFWNAWRVDPQNRPAGAPPLLAVDLGSWNTLLGRSYGEIAGESRSMHKSQGFGAAERRGKLVNYLELMGGAPARIDPFEGIDMTWARIPGGQDIDPLLAEAERNFDPEYPEKVLPHLLPALGLVRELPRSVWVETKQEELEEVIRQVSGLWLEAIASEPAVTPGGEISVTVSAINRSGFPMRLEVVRPPFGTPVVAPEAKLETNEPVSVEMKIPVGADAPISHPYWLRFPHDEGAYVVEEQTLIGEPAGPGAQYVEVLLSVGDQIARYLLPVHYRWVDRVEGEVHRALQIVPAATANPDSTLYVFPDELPKPITVFVRAGREEMRGAVHLELPAGWRSEPESLLFSLPSRGSEAALSFTIHPGLATENGILRIVADTESAGRQPLSLAVIDHPHIPRQSLFPLAAADLLRADIRKRGERIGYVMGSGDEVPEALRQIGYQVTLLGEEMLDGASLEHFDAIVVGVRAFNTNERLLAQQKRLLDYVSKGGTLVVQYNTDEERLKGAIGPFPFEVSRDRVTVEDAPVTLLREDHPLLTTPNRIAARDFEGWVQERGLYFPGSWDPRYEAVLEMHDPDEPERKGSILYVRHGKGVFIYTGLSFFRQLPAGVAGAYRLFANLVSAR